MAYELKINTSNVTEDENGTISGDWELLTENDWIVRSDYVDVGAMVEDHFEHSLKVTKWETQHPGSECGGSGWFVAEEETDR